MKRTFVASAWLTGLALLAACSGETQLPEATGKGTLRAINAIKTSPAISFLIEERSIGIIDYKSGTSTVAYDDLDYTFNFDTFLAGDTQVTRIASQFLSVARDTHYTFVVSGDLADPVISIWERPQPEFAEGATEFELQVGHLGASLGDVDVYFADPATPPALGNALGTLAEGEVLPVSRLAAGEYVLTLTAVGDPTTVLFESDALPSDAGGAYLFAVFDPDARDIAPVAVRRFDVSLGTGLLVPDANYPGTFRFFHASANAGIVDIYVDDPLTAPLVAGHAFGDISGDVDMPGGIIPLTYTAAGNPGSLLVELDRGIVAGVRYFGYLLEDTEGNLGFVDIVPNLRSVETLGKLSVMPTIPTEVGFDFYAIPTGESIDDAQPLLGNLGVGTPPLELDLIADMLDIYVTQTGEKTPLAGPIPLDLANGDVIQAIIYENVDPNIVDVVLLPLP